MNISLNLIVEILYHGLGIGFLYLITLIFRFGDNLTKKSEILWLIWVCSSVALISLIQHKCIVFE